MLLNSAAYVDQKSLQGLKNPNKKITQKLEKEKGQEMVKYVSCLCIKGEGYIAAYFPVKSKPRTTQ